MNSSKNKICVNQLLKAESFIARLRGLLGRKSLAQDEGLWIDRCPSIHTCFMNFSIDVVFLDSDFVVQKTFENVRPWRLIGPVWRARSVLELNVGAIKQAQIEVGDQLNVVS